MTSWSVIAEFLHAKTKDGGLSVKATGGLPFLLREGMDVTFVPPLLHFPRSAKVVRLESPTPSKHLVYFEGIDTRSEAEKLKGHFCLVKTDDLPQLDQAEQLMFCEGWSVVDVVHGCIGVVDRVEENPAHPLLVVRREPIRVEPNDVQEDTSDSPGKEVFIPLVDSFIDHIDEEVSSITVSLPDGLLEL